MESRGIVARKEAPHIGGGESAARFASGLKARYTLPKVDRTPVRIGLASSSFVERLLAQTTRYASASRESFRMQYRGRTDFHAFERMQRVVSRIAGLMRFVTARALRRDLRHESDATTHRTALRATGAMLSVSAMRIPEAQVARSIGISGDSIQRLSPSETRVSRETGRSPALNAEKSFSPRLLQRVQQTPAGGPSYRIFSFLRAIHAERRQIAVSIPGIKSAATESKRVRPWPPIVAVAALRANRVRRAAQAQRRIVPPTVASIAAIRARPSVVTALALRQADLRGSWPMRTGSVHPPVRESLFLPMLWRIGGQHATDTGQFRTGAAGFTVPSTDTEPPTRRQTEHGLWTTNRPGGTVHTDAAYLSHSAPMRRMLQEASLLEATLQRQNREAQRTRTVFRQITTAAMLAGTDSAMTASAVTLRRPTRRSQQGVFQGDRMGRLRPLVVEATAARRQTRWSGIRTAGLSRLLHRLHISPWRKGLVSRAERAVSRHTAGASPGRQPEKAFPGNSRHSVPVDVAQRTLLLALRFLRERPTAFRSVEPRQTMLPEENVLEMGFQFAGFPGLKRAPGEHTRRGAIFGIRNRDVAAFNANRLPPFLLNAYRSERVDGEGGPRTRIGRRIHGESGNERHIAALLNKSVRERASGDTRKRVARTALQMPSIGIALQMPGIGRELDSPVTPTETRLVPRTRMAEIRATQRQMARSFPTVAYRRVASYASHSENTISATEARHQPAQEASEFYTILSPTALRARLVQWSGPGRLLDSALRARLGPTLGFDPALARIHQGPVAAEAARQLRAEAFTIGTDVFFGADQFRPTTLKGLGLLAHELTHVGQQRRLAPAMRFFTPQGGDAMEQEAQQKALQIMAETNEQAGMMHPDVQPPRPSMAYAPAYGLPKSGGTPEPAQTATEERGPNTTKPTPSPRRADPRAVADRVYELMQRELAHIQRFDVAGRR